MFKVGDKVQLKDQSSYGGSWTGPMTVTKVYGSKDFYIDCINYLNDFEGAFVQDELELVVEDPIYRVCVQRVKNGSGFLMTGEYATIDAAKKAILDRGCDGDFTFTIYQTISSHKVNTNPTLVDLPL